MRELRNSKLDTGAFDAVDTPSTKPQPLKYTVSTPPTTIDSQSASPASGCARADEATYSPGHFYFFSHDFGTLCSPTGLPRFTDRCKRWIHAVTGEWPDFEKSGDVILPSPSRPSGRLLAEDSPLPEAWVLQSLVDTFLCSDFSRCFPFIDRLLFEESRRLAYSPPAPGDSWTASQLSARAYVFAVCAITADKFTDARVSERLDAEAWVRQAEHLLISVSGDASLTTLQASLMMVNYLYTQQSLKASH